MAVQTRKAAAAADEPLNVAGNSLDEMVEGGLPDDFDGTIVKARYVPWDYNGKIDHHVLGVALTIKPDDGNEFVQTFSAGDLTDFQPSMDGRTAVDLNSDDAEDHEGIYALKVGKKPGLNNNSNWAQFVGALIDANFDKASIKANVDFLEGTYAHFNRIDQKKRSGIVVNRGEGNDRNNRTPQILVITELKESGKKPATKAGGAKPAAGASKSAAPAAKPAGKPVTKKEEVAEASGEGESLEDRMRAVVTEAVLAAEEGLPKAKLASIMMANFQAAEKAKAIKLVQSAEFLASSETWLYDEDSATLFSNA